MIFDCFIGCWAFIGMFNNILILRITNFNQDLHSQKQMNGSGQEAAKQLSEGLEQTRNSL